MPLTKLTAYTKLISDLADKPNMTSAELKAYFDNSPEEIRVALNDVIDALKSTTTDSGASNIGAQPIETSPSNVQGILEWLKQQIDYAAIGTLPDGSVTDEKLSSDQSDLKQRFASFEAQKGAPNGLATLDGSGVLAQKPYVTGTYTGDGLASRTINLGFTPSAVYVTNDQGITKDGTVHYGGLATNGFSLKAYSDDQVFDVLTVTAGGFIVYYAEDTNVTYTSQYRYVYTNRNSEVMTYVAWR